VRAAVGGPFAKGAGDALYTVLVWTLVLLVAPRARPVVAAGVALGISWAVEFFQLSPVPAELSRQSAAARLVLGSTFEAQDLCWYLVGAAAACALHLLSDRYRRRSGTPGRHGTHGMTGTSDATGTPGTTGRSDAGRRADAAR
jgi:hypothetical protein